MIDLLPEFVAETREMLQAVTGALVAWEADPSDRALLDQIFRFVHTVKGSCGFLDLPRLQRLSHAAEDALAQVRAGSRHPNGAFVTAVLAVIDRIGEVAEAIAAGKAVSDEGEHRLIDALSAPTEPAPDRTPPKVRTALPRPPSRTIRLPVDLLDRMMASVSDMVLARNELARDIDCMGAKFDGGAFDRLSVCVRELREAVTRARMARVDTLFAAVPRLVRDLATELGKQVRLEIDGGDVELDREMIEMIRDPLIHIVRNAIDHGVEAPAVRLAGGKPAAGHLKITARQSGNRISIVLRDDGGGIDPAQVVDRAVAAGILTRTEGIMLEPARQLDLIFAPGLSTAARVTEISGRGVGMDIVRSNVERLGGTVRVESEVGAGTRLLIEVPLTLTIIPALTVSAAGMCFAVPRAGIEEIVAHGKAARIERFGSGYVAIVRGVRLPVASLPAIMADEPGGTPNLLVIARTAGGGRFAMGVDSVHDHEDLVIKPASPEILASGLFAGTTLSDNSRPMLLLDTAGVAAVAGITPVILQPSPEPVSAPAPTLPTLIFRDLDGAERAVRLDVVDRIEDVPRQSAIESGGRHLLVHGDVVTPLYLAADLPERDRLRVFRVQGEDGDLAYAMDHVVDVAEVTVEVAPSHVPGAVAGTLLYEGRPVELLDIDYLLRRTADKTMATPSCSAAIPPAPCLAA